MCLGIPMKVKKIKKNKNICIAELDGVKREIAIHLLPDVNIGDYIIAHAGFAIQKLNEKEAKETLKLIKEAYGLE